jgi:hypothetical protein
MLVVLSSALSLHSWRDLQDCNVLARDADSAIEFADYHADIPTLSPCCSTTLHSRLGSEYSSWSTTTVPGVKIGRGRTPLRIVMPCHLSLVFHLVFWIHYYSRNMSRYCGSKNTVEERFTGSHPHVWSCGYPPESVASVVQREWLDGDLPNALVLSCVTSQLFYWTVGNRD